MDIRTYIHLIINNWRILLASAVITVAATLVFTLQQPRIYESESTFVIRPHSSLILQDEFVSTLDTLSRRVEINNTFAEVTTSKLIKDRAAENLGLTSEQRQGLSASGRVLAGTNILRLTVQGRDPEVAQAFAEAVSEETVAYVSNLYDVFELGQLDAASLSRTPVSPKPGLNLTIGLVLGVILGLALIFLREYLNSPGGLQRRFDIIDPDSGVYNRSYLDMRLRQEMSRTHHTGGHLSLALLRVSDRNTVDFKASPSAMPPVAIIIEPLLRDEDLLARYDQSTFVIILPDLSGYEAQAAVEKMRLRLGAAPVAPEHLQRMAGLRGAAGVAELLSADNNEESLLTRAMEALNEAERGTYGRVVLSTPSADGGAPLPDSRRQTIPAGPQLVKDTPLTIDAAVNGVVSTGGSSNGIKANGIVTNGANGHGTNGKSAHTNGNGSSAPAEESPETEQSLNTEEPLETEESPEPAELAHEFPAPSAPSLTRAALRLAQQFNIDPASIEGTGKDGRVLKSDVKNYINSLGS
jgi:diguanylate cyclase (GGDEF)-like protein